MQIYLMFLQTDSICKELSPIKQDPFGRQQKYDSVICLAPEGPMNAYWAGF